MVRIGDGGGDGGGEKPAWLERLMEETFFAGCGSHQTKRKNEKNIFCLACCLSFCPHCLPSHRSHPLLQPYTINGAKVIFLKQRTQSSRVQSSRVWNKAATPNVCFTCDRILQPPFHFCCLSCKVEHMVCDGEGLASIWISSSTQMEGLRVDNSGLIDEDDQMMTPNSTIGGHEYFESHDNNSSMPTYHASSSDAVLGVGGDTGGADMFTKRKKKGSMTATTTATTSTTSGSSGGSGAATGSGTSRFLSVFSLNSRRKGAPHRAPLS